MTVIISGDTGIDTVGSNTVGNGQLIDGSVQHAKLGFTLPFTKEYVSPDQTISNNSSFTLLHGLGTAYKLCSVTLKCIAADQGYSIGDEVEMGVRQDHSTGNYGFNTRRVGSTGIGIRILSLGMYVHGAGGTGVGITITPANWRLIVRAWA
jgi:hypothetical protein